MTGMIKTREQENAMAVADRKETTRKVDSQRSNEIFDIERKKKYVDHLKMRSLNEENMEDGAMKTCELIDPLSKRYADLG